MSNLKKISNIFWDLTIKIMFQPVTLIIFLIMVFNTKCTNNNPTGPPESQNKPPVIDSFSSNPITSDSSRLPAGGIIEFQVTATDPDQDVLTYTWECDGGDFTDGLSTNTVKWQAPIALVTSEYNITVKVSDGAEIKEQNKTVYVAAASSGINVNPSMLEFGTYQDTIMIKIFNIGLGTINWEIRDLANWMTASPSSGNIPQPDDTSISKIIVNRNSLTPGTYDHTFKIVNTDSNSNQVSVGVSMTVAIMGFVKGHVQYAGTTIPISDVSVNIDNKSSTTNTDGSYRLDSISIGDKVLYASKDGYDPYQTGLTVVQGSNNKDIEMTSAQYTHYLSGTITSAGNLEPLPGVTVTVLNDDGSPSQLQSTTDVNGRYQVTNVPEGLRIVKFQKQNYQTRTVQILISTSNNNYNVQLSNKPGIPSNPNPLDNATDQDLNLTLSWDCSDPNGDELKYDVYFGTSNPPSQLVEQNYTYSNLPTVIFNYANALPRKIINIRLLPATTYYWKIIAKDNFNNITEGPIWNFTTSDKFGTVTDIDGNVYLTIQIGTQLWMAENLKVTHYNNGNDIPHVTDSLSWPGLTSGAYCNYYNDENLVDTYGRLYNWYAAHDTRKIAPTGWHVPTDAEWQTLVQFLGDSLIAGGDMKTTGDTYNLDGVWYWPNTGATNNSGFSAEPGGLRYIGGFFSGFFNLGASAKFWSSTEWRPPSNSARGRKLSSQSSEVFRIVYPKWAGFSVRCIKD